MTRPAKHGTRFQRKGQPRTIVRKKSTIVRSISAIALKFKELFPNRTPLELAVRTGASPSLCEKFLDGRIAHLGGEFQQELLQSDVGRQMLVVIMGDSRAPWWLGLRKQLELVDAKRDLAAARRRIDAIETDGL